MPENLPKYLQVSEALIRRIAAGQIADGARLPPEREMAQDLGLSVGTLRKALDVLVEKKVLVRVQGSGNYIRHRSDVTSIYGMFRLELPRGGGLPTARVLSSDMRPCPPFAPSSWTRRDVWCIRRERLLDGDPVAAEEIWLNRATSIPARELGPSLYRAFQDRLGIVIARVEDRIGLAPAPDWIPVATGIIPAASCCHVWRTGCDANGDPVEISQSWYNHKRAHYVSRVGKGE